MKTNADCADITLRCVCLLVLFVAGVALGIHLERGDRAAEQEDRPCLYTIHRNGADATDVGIYRDGGGR